MKRLSIVLLLAMSVPAVSWCADPTPEIVRFRGGTPNFCRSLVESARETDRAKTGRKIVFFGGDFLYNSNTYTPSAYLLVAPAEAQGKKQSFSGGLIAACGRDPMPKASVFSTVSNTKAPSWNGAFYFSNRGILGRAGGGQPADVNLVILDFAPNDRGLAEPIVQAGLEGMLRQARAQYPLADILLVHGPSRALLQDYREGKTPDIIAYREKMAEHYGIPSVNLARLIAEKILSGELKEDIFLGDTVLSDAGDKVCLDAVMPLLVQSLEVARQSPAFVTNGLPAPLSRYRIETPAPNHWDSVVPYNRATWAPGWLDWQASPLERYLHVLQGETPGPELTLRFKGDVVGVTLIVGPDSGDLEYSLDGAAWTLKRVFAERRGDAYEDMPVLLGEGLKADVEHTLKLRVAPNSPKGSGGKTVRIANFLINGKPIYEDPFQGMTPLQRIDSIYAGMEPITYRAPGDRWKYLAKTMKRLEEGPSLTLVMLGDSIVQDTASSNFELLMERMYPKCKVRKMVSVRGSTGCEWYSQENRVQEYVLKHNPDLLIIGGISNRGIGGGERTEPIRDVIRQVRAAKPDTDILLLSDAFGLNEDPRLKKDWREFVTPDGTDYRSRLMKLAAEEKAEFIDMRGLWGRYILDSKWICLSFQRDGIHANWRGSQIVGRILEAYFAPKP
jgi:lysophospholipase L1-like esterase